MSHPVSEEPEQNIVEPMVSVAGNAQEVHILMIGAGRGCSALMEVFPRYDWVHLDVVVDSNSKAVAFPLAEAQGIPCSTDVEQALAGFHGDLVVDATGDPAIDTRLKVWSSQKHIEIISGKSAKLLYDMSLHQISDRKAIHTQNAHMVLLDSLLEISRGFSYQLPLSSVAKKTLKGIYKPAMAIKGLALIFSEADTAKVVGAVGIKKPASSIPMQSLRDICAKLSTDVHFHLLSEPFRINTHSGQMLFNIVMPFWQGQILSGVLLFAIPGEIGSEQKHVLDIASTHLRIITTMLEHHKNIEKMAALDSLTGIYNRRMFEASLQQGVSRCQRNSSGHLSCAFIDVDDFKYVNDTYGHMAGDAAIKHIVTCIQQCIRNSDVIARYGGDEFVLLLPSDCASDIAHVYHVGERILERVSTTPTPDYPVICISVSIGIATQSSSVVDGKTLLLQADEALSQAKLNGKSCISTVDHTSPA